MQATDMSKWDYLWSITRGRKCAELFIESGLLGISNAKYMLILKDGKKEFAPIEKEILDECRAVAEQFVMDDYIWE